MSKCKDMIDSQKRFSFETLIFCARLVGQPAGGWQPAQRKRPGVIAIEVVLYTTQQIERWQIECAGVQDITNPLTRDELRNLQGVAVARRGTAQNLLGCPGHSETCLDSSRSAQHFPEAAKPRLVAFDRYASFPECGCEPIRRARPC